MSKMKPCPFCGSDEYAWQDHPEKCYLYRIVKQVNSDCMAYCKESCEESWNRRPIENKLDAENKRLKTRIEKLHKIAAENTIGYEAIIESLRSENEKLKEKKGIK